ncbi:hypothetical protein RUND412_007631, partial [Rhizina undulata]
MKDNLQELEDAWDKAVRDGLARPSSDNPEYYAPEQPEDEEDRGEDDDQSLDTENIARAKCLIIRVLS